MASQRSFNKSYSFVCENLSFLLELSPSERTILVIAIIATVVLAVLVIFCLSIKKRCNAARRRRTRRSTEVPCPAQTLDPPAELTFDQIPGDMRNAPPSYEEAITSSRLTLNTSSLAVYFTETNNNNNSTQALSSSRQSIDSSRPNIDSTEEAYDSTGLPSYAEAHRLSQSSLSEL